MKEKEILFYCSISFFRIISYEKYFCKIQYKKNNSCIRRYTFTYTYIAVLQRLRNIQRNSQRWTHMPSIFHALIRWPQLRCQHVMLQLCTRVTREFWLLNFRACSRELRSASRSSSVDPEIRPVWSDFR